MFIVRRLIKDLIINMVVTQQYNQIVYSLLSTFVMLRSSFLQYLSRFRGLNMPNSPPPSAAALRARKGAARGLGSPCSSSEERQDEVSSPSDSERRAPPRDMQPQPPQPMAEGAARPPAPSAPNTFFGIAERTLHSRAQVTVTD